MQVLQRLETVTTDILAMFFTTAAGQKSSIYLCWQCCCTLSLALQVFEHLDMVTTDFLAMFFTAAAAQ